jgi:hypothetical protein
VGEVADVCTCDNTLGSPAVANVVVVGGASITFTGADGACTQVEGVPPPVLWGYDAEDTAVSGAGLTSTTLGFSVLDLDGPAEDTQGFSMGWSHTSGFTAASVSSIDAAGDVAGVNGGSGPDFFGTSTFANGWTVGVVYAFLGGQFVQFPAGSPAAVTATYDYDITGDDTIVVSIDNGLGSPPVANVVVVAGASFDAVAGSTGGSIAITLQVETRFIRGDCNDDGIVDIADGVFAIGTLFYGYTAACPAACDANDDSFGDLSVAIYVLNYQFLDGPPPPAPFPACGGDGGPGCASSCP